MPAPKHAMEIFEHLDKSNCRECGKSTCLAFAGAVFTGAKDISECPRLPAEVIERFSDTRQESSVEDAYTRHLENLIREVQALDLAEAAQRTGGIYRNGRLILKILGKNFSIDEAGKISSDIHINPWVTIPFLNYVIYAKGAEPTGDWIGFRDLDDGKERYPLFQKRCEEAMKGIADRYTELFDDIVTVLFGRQVPEEFQSDVSVVMYPLPKVPIMICYWMPDEGMASSLNLFFDRSANQNLDTGSLFNLAAGLTQMFSKIALRHGTLVEAVS